MGDLQLLVDRGHGGCVLDDDPFRRVDRVAVEGLVEARRRQARGGEGEVAGRRDVAARVAARHSVVVDGARRETGERDRV